MYPAIISNLGFKKSSSNCQTPNSNANNGKVISHHHQRSNSSSSASSNSLSKSRLQNSKRFSLSSNQLFKSKSLPSSSNGFTKSPPKLVVAIHNFEKENPHTDLQLVKGEEYLVLDTHIEGCGNWWRVQNKYGDIGLIPSNYVKEKSKSHYLRQFPWFLPKLDREAAEKILKEDDREGSFVVRLSSTQDLFTISLLVKNGRSSVVKHYLIRMSNDGQFFIKDNCFFSALEDLIHYHRNERGSLATKLKYVPNLGGHHHKNTFSSQISSSKSLLGSTSKNRLHLNSLNTDKSWEIRATDLSLSEELGSGQFGVVRRGKWKDMVEVAVKLMKEGTMSEHDFIEEAKVMTKLQHPNLVQLFGLCIEHRPICIVTEFMKHGSLLSYLRNHENWLKQRPMLLLDMCLQVCSGMAYLEAHNYIHRDLAARNCLVGEGYIVKVADFGLTRCVIDDEYTSSGGTKFPIKWAPPEVLRFTRFSSKSDVWAYGVLMWEMFTCGKMPYGKSSNAQVVGLVINGERLEKPKLCTKEVFGVMQSCWEELSEYRPSFAQLSIKLKSLMRSKNTHNWKSDEILTKKS